MDYSQRTGQSRSGSLVDDRRYNRQRGGSPYRGQRGSGSNRNQLKSRSIRFRGKGSAGMTRFAGLDMRKIIMAVLGLVLVILLFFLVSSCVRSCRANKPATSEADARVAAGLSEDLVGEFTVALDQAEALEWIALNATAYPSEDLPRLALAEPAAIAFVRAYPDMAKSGSAYGDTVSKGEVPMLFNWDERWGAVDYDGSALAVTGSGPTSLAMAYMGLTGKNDKTPADMAQLATDKGFAGGDSHTTSEFFTTIGKDLGLDVHEIEASSDILADELDSGTVVLVEVRSETLTDATHWVVVAYENENGSVRVYDPTSPSASARPWDPATISSASIRMYAVSVIDAEAEAEAEE